MTRPDHNNTNGLVDGAIPAWHPCPFIRRCAAATDACPNVGKMRSASYSCAAARAHSLIVNHNKNTRGEQR